MVTRTPLGSSPNCPRCGYDQSGVAASWTESCPLTGVCSECGLEFAWRSVLSEDPRHPRWLFEHAPKWWRLRAVAHVRLCMRPAKLWRRVELVHAVNTRRLAAFGVLLLGVLYFGLGIERAVGLLISAVLAPILPYSYFPFRSLEDPRLWQECMTLLLWPAGSRQVMISYAVPVWAAGVFLAVPMALVPLELILLRQSLRAAKVRFGHILRASVYFLAVITVVWISGNAALDAAVWLADLGIIGLARSESVQATILLILATTGLFVAWWWRCWVTLHLRMRHGWLTGVLLVVMAALAWLLVLVLIALARMRSI